MPPTKPGASPGRSAMEKAMKAASTGTISARADLAPMLKKASASEPGSLKASMPKAKEMAMQRPPAVTSGIM